MQTDSENSEFKICPLYPSGKNCDNKNHALTALDFKLNFSMIKM